MVKFDISWLYFDKDHAKSFNVCRICSSKYKVTTSVTILRKHLKKHKLEESSKKHAPFEEEQKNHDEYLVDWACV